MIKHLTIKMLVILTLALGFSRGAWGQLAAPEATPAQAQGESVTSGTVVTFQGKIVSIDRGQKAGNTRGAAREKSDGLGPESGQP
jgi:hypothetical protein